MNDRQSRIAHHDTISTTFFHQVTRLEPEAWARFVRVYGPVIFYWCRRDGVREDDAADIGQEVFRAVAANICRFERKAGSSFVGWLRTITRNKVVDHWRHLEKRPLAVGGTDFQQTVQRVPSTDRIDQESDARELVEDAVAEHEITASKITASEITASEIAADKNISERVRDPIQDAGNRIDKVYGDENTNDGSQVRAILAHQTLGYLKSQFSAKAWSAFWETAVNDRTSNDVAAELGMTPMAVRKAKSRVLSKLRQELDTEFEF